MNKYALVIEPLSDEDGGGFVAFFPDLVGCISDGDTYEQAAANAEQALLSWLEVQSEREVQVAEAGNAQREFQERAVAMNDHLAELVRKLEVAEARIKALEARGPIWGRFGGGRVSTGSSGYVSRSFATG